MLNSVPDRRPERLQMADAVTERMTIHASKEACLDVLLEPDEEAVVLLRGLHRFPA